MRVQKLILPGLVSGVIVLMLAASYLSGLEQPFNQAQAQTRSGAALGSAKNSNGGCLISQSFPDSIRQWCQVIQKYASDNGLDPDLVSSVILQESSGRPDAYSKSGAVGLMQVMPRDGLASKFNCINGPCFATRPTMQDLFDPEFNIAYGTHLLAGLIQSTGTMRDALKAYGPLDVGYRYADLILNTYNQRSQN